MAEPSNADSGPNNLVQTIREKSGSQLVPNLAAGYREFFSMTSRALDDRHHNNPTVSL